MRLIPRLVVGLAATSLIVAACSESASSSDGAPAPSPGARLQVVAGFYPLAYAAQQVGGDDIDVVTLAAPGVEPHDLELSPTQVAEIADADLVLYVKGLQPAVDEAIAQEAADAALDATDGLPLLPAAEGDAEGGVDPHVWLYPRDMASIGRAIAARIGQADPDNAAAADARAVDLTARMDALDTEFRTGLANCEIKDLVVSHEAFGYLADAYGLTQVGLSGLDPSAEPSPARLKEVADFVRAKGIDTIYYEVLIDPKIAQTIADETGAATAVLDPIEGLAANATGDYETIMRANLAALREGQHCS